MGPKKFKSAERVQDSDSEDLDGGVPTIAEHVAPVARMSPSKSKRKEPPTTSTPLTSKKSKLEEKSSSKRQKSQLNVESSSKARSAQHAPSSSRKPSQKTSNILTAKSSGRPSVTKNSTAKDVKLPRRLSKSASSSSSSESSEESESEPNDALEDKGVKSTTEKDKRPKPTPQTNGRSKVNGISSKQRPASTSSTSEESSEEASGDDSSEDGESGNRPKEHEKDTRDQASKLAKTTKVNGKSVPARHTKSSSSSEGSSEEGSTSAAEHEGQAAKGRARVSASGSSEDASSDENREDGGDRDEDGEESSEEEEESADEDRNSSEDAQRQSQAASSRTSSISDPPAVQPRPQVTEEVYVPQNGFKELTLSETSTRLAQTLSAANLAGKELWYITAPSDLALEDVMKLSPEKLRDMQAKSTHLKHKGKEYELNREDVEANSKPRLLTAQKDVFTAIADRPQVDAVYSLRTTFSVPPQVAALQSSRTESQAASVVTLPEIRESRSQPPDMKMRYFPPGAEPRQQQSSNISRQRKPPTVVRVETPSSGPETPSAQSQSKNGSRGKATAGVDRVKGSKKAGSRDQRHSSSSSSSESESDSSEEK